MQSVKSLFKWILILTVVDIIMITAFVYWINATPDVSIAELLIVPTIFILNLLIGLSLIYLTAYKVIGKAFAWNSVIASIVFHLLFYAWFIYYDYINFKKFYFKQFSKKYELLLDKRDTSYSISELGDGSSLEFKRGRYFQQQDTIMLDDSSKKLFIYQSHLIGYPKGRDTVSLKDE